MQTKDDICSKYSAALNEILQLKRSVDHWRNEAQYHIWRGKKRGQQIYLDRQRFRYKLYLGTRPWWTRLFERFVAMPART